MFHSAAVSAFLRRRIHACIEFSAANLKVALALRWQRQLQRIISARGTWLMTSQVWQKFTKQDQLDLLHDIENQPKKQTEHRRNSKNKFLDNCHKLLRMCKLVFSRMRQHERKIARKTRQKINRNYKYYNRGRKLTETEMKIERKRFGSKPFPFISLNKINKARPHNLRADFETTTRKQTLRRKAL